MVSLTALWLPIVLSAIFVFAASSIVHMVLTYHRNDVAKMNDEDAVRAAMRAAGVTPGDYFIPYGGGPKEMNTPEMRARFEEGPVGFVSIMPSGMPRMGKALATWFAYTLVVSFFTAYLTGRTLGPGAEYLAVHRVAGTVAFLSYSMAHASDSIWKGQKWATTLRHMFDGLVYGLLTGGCFGWLWP